MLIDIKLPSSSALSSSDSDATTRSGSSAYTSSIRFLPFVGNKKTVLTITALGDGSFLCGSSDFTITRWSSSRGECIQTFPLEFKKLIKSIITLGENETFASLHITQNSGMIRKWSLRIGKWVSYFIVHPEPVAIRQLQHYRKGSVLVGVLFSNKVGVWNIDGDQIQSLQDKSFMGDSLCSICELDDGRVVTGTKEGQIKVWCWGDENYEGGCTQTLGQSVHNDCRAEITHVAQAKKRSGTSGTLLTLCWLVVRGKGESLFGTLKREPHWSSLLT